MCVLYVQLYQWDFSGTQLKKNTLAVQETPG